MTILDFPFCNAVNVILKNKNGILFVTLMQRSPKNKAWAETIVEMPHF